MKKIISFAVLVLLVGSVIAGTEGKQKGDSDSPKTTEVTTISVLGQVTDIQSGEVLAGVEVMIEGTDMKAFTDFDGNFKIDNVKPGNYNLVASLISYKKSLLEEYTLSNDNKPIEIKLEISE